MIKSNKWREVRDYINSHSEFTTKMMRKDISKFDSMYLQYLIFVKHAGFITRVDTASYVRVVKIPETMSLNAIKKYYKQEFESKRFIQSLIRKEKIKEITNGSFGD